MAQKFGEATMVKVVSGRYEGKQGVVIGHQTGWLIDRHVVKLEGVDRPVRLAAEALSVYTPPPPSGLDAWIP